MKFTLKKLSYLAFLWVFLVTSLILASCASWSNGALAKEYYNLGNAYYTLKKYPESARAFQIAMKLDPRLTVAHVNLVEALGEQGDWDGAWEFLQPLLKKDPKNTIYLKIQAYLLWERKDKDASAELWKSLAKELPADTDTQYNFAYVAHEEGWENDEWNALKAYADLGGTKPQAWKLLGKEAFKRRNWNRALQAYQQVVKLDTTDAVSYAQLSQVYVNLEQFDNAASALKQALQAEKNAPSPTSTPTSTPFSQAVSSPLPGPTPVPPPIPTPLSSPEATTSPTPTSTPLASPGSTAPASASPAQAPEKPPTAHEAEWSFQLGTIYLYGMDDYSDAIAAYREAWHAGMTDLKVWQHLVNFPGMPQKERLIGDLRTLGLEGSL